jgi:hypothetical protein
MNSVEEEANCKVPTVCASPTADARVNATNAKSSAKVTRFQPKIFDSILWLTILADETLSFKNISIIILIINNISRIAKKVDEDSSL